MKKLIALVIIFILGITNIIVGQNYQKEYSKTPIDFFEASKPFVKTFNSVMIQDPSGTSNDYPVRSHVISNVDYNDAIKVEIPGVSDPLYLVPITPVTYTTDSKGKTVGIRTYSDITGEKINVVTDGGEVMIGSDKAGYFFFYNNETPGYKPYNGVPPDLPSYEDHTRNNTYPF